MLYALILQFTVQVGFASLTIKCFSTEGKLGRTRRRKKEKRKKERKQATNKKLPCNEEDPAFLDILFSDKIKVINCISAFVGREVSSEILIA